MLAEVNSDSFHSNLDGLIRGDLKLRLKRLRYLEDEMTQVGFARALGLSPQTISNWETGKNRPSIKSLRLISRHYTVSWSWLLTGETDGADLPPLGESVKEVARR